MKKRLRAATAAAVILLVLGTVGADEAPEEDPCRDPQTTHEMRRCAEYRFQKADKELNGLYRELTAKLEGTRKQKLVEAQRAWIVYRDKKAAYEASVMEGGTMEPVLYTASRASTTRERVKDLERYLEVVKAR